MRQVFVGVIFTALFCFVLVPGAFAQSASGTTTLSAAYVDEGSIVVNDATTSLAQAGTIWGSFSGTTSITIKIRTSVSSGNGSLTFTQAAFAAGGPALGTSGDLSYTTSDYSLGTNGSATGHASSKVAAAGDSNTAWSYGADARSLDAGDTKSVSWTLVNRPAIKEGTQTSLVTFTLATA